MTVYLYSLSSPSITFLGTSIGDPTQLPEYSFRVPADFPSPAADHLERHISLDELFDLRAPHMYLVQVESDSIQEAGIYSRDLLIVDRRRDADHGDIVIAAVNTEPVWPGDDAFGQRPPHPRLGYASRVNESVLYDANRPALDRICPLRACLVKQAKTIKGDFNAVEKTFFGSGS